MSLQVFNRREVKAERVFFIPAGTVVDSVTVAVATWPDNVPLTNYTNFEILEIETLEPEREVETETFMIPAPAGGYMEDLDETIKATSWTAETARTSNLVKMLEHGLATLPVAGTAQAPFVRTENFVEGVLLKETQVRGVGMTERLQIWARCYLVTQGSSGPKTSKVQLRFRKMHSANNTFVIAV